MRPHQAELVVSPLPFKTGGYLSESVTIPKELLRNLYAGLARVEEVLATLKDLIDRESLQRIRKAEEEYEKRRIHNHTNQQ